ncbi:MAG TPA: hypothetical protein VKS60_21600 [Stellaceae bacterium]|nr:hypothetical protein [Stellaceae bacterium]
MQKATLAATLLIALALAPSGATAGGKLRFWNLTAYTIVELSLAKPGTDQWGPNQCDNDPDRAVDADERLDLKDVPPGRYDVKLADKSGRRCTVRNVEVKDGGKYAFSLSEDDLKDCGK